MLVPPVLSPCQGVAELSLASSLPWEWSGASLVALMPSAHLLQGQPQLAAVSVKGYRELLRRLRAEQAPQGAAEERAASTLLQQAKERVLLYAQKKRRIAEPLNPRRVPCCHCHRAAITVCL